MKTATPTSPLRREARRVISQVIDDHVWGTAHCLPHADILQLRAKLREFYPFKKGEIYPYRIWCEEVRNALGFEVRKAKRWAKPNFIHVQNVMPAMREWVKSKGLLTNDPRFL